MSLFAELKRRNVFRVGVAYVLMGWVLLQGADFALDLIGAPNWVIQALSITVIMCLPFALFFAWAFEMTPEGIKRESEIDRSQSITPQTGQKLNRAIIVFLALAVLLLLADRFINVPGGSETAGTDTAAVEQTDPALIESSVRDQPAADRSVAVLPFVAMSNGSDDAYFADGLTEEILNSLSQLPELLVTARTSAFHFKGKDLPVGEIAAKLGVGHIVEGSVRRSGERLRVTAQLIRAADGFHLWSSNYDSTSADTIAVQEDIAEKIALAMDVVLDEEKRQEMHARGLRDVEAFIAFQRARELYELAHRSGSDITGILQRANVYLEDVQQRVPDFPVAWMMHSDRYVHLIIEDAASVQTVKLTDQEIAEALARVNADYEAAIRAARTSGERIRLEMDQAYLNGNWHGMTDRIEQFLETTGCDDFGWYNTLTLPYGYAARMSGHAEHAVACDPLLASNWRSLASTRLWAGDADAVIDSARRGLAIEVSDAMLIDLAKGLLMNGRAEDARIELETRLKGSSEDQGIHVMMAAEQGDRERAKILFAEYLKSEKHQNFRTLTMYAWIGDRENANRMAAELDRHPFGAVVLSMSALLCECGAPWDLSATPDFALKIEESGLNWPPLSPFNFPLKDW